ncbi:hypothetical protein OROHE_018302 [Orobanche hederae]
MGLPAAARGLGVHWLLAAAAKTEEVSSSDSDGSLFIHNEFGMCRTITEIDHLGGSRKRSSDQFEFEAAAGNNIAEAGRSSSRASDDDENGINTRKKLGLSKQSTFLKKALKNRTLSIQQKQKLALAEQLNLRPQQVEVWFQNRRASGFIDMFAKSVSDKALAEHEDIGDAVGSEKPLNLIMVWISSNRY